MDSEHALRVVEAVEVIKSWADSVSVDATARYGTAVQINWRIDLDPATPAPPHHYPTPLTLEILTDWEKQQAGPPPF